METGTVKWFNNGKFYGLITSDDDQLEIPIFNYRDECLMEGQKVKYKRFLNNTEIIATDLTVVDKNYRNNTYQSKLQEVILNDHPRISIYDNVFSEEQCKDLILRSTSEDYVAKYIDVNDHKKNCSRESSGQFNQNSIKRKILNDFYYKDYDSIVSAVASALNRPYSLFESMDILRYQKSHFMAPHHDFPYNPKKLNYYQKSGTREGVALLYLNDNFIGGETYFPKLGIKIKPKIGRLSVWYHSGNLDLDWNLMHESLEIIEGEKFAVIMCLSSLPRLETKGI